MKNIRVREGQSILDIALQYYGDVSAAFIVVKDNSLSGLDVSLDDGQILSIREAGDSSPFFGFQDPATVTYYESVFIDEELGFYPSTGNGNELIEVQDLEGIDYWYIEVDFIVN